MTWPAKKLGEVAEVIMGQSPPSSSYNERGEGLPFFQGKAEFGEIYPTPVKYCSSPNRIAEANDILISVRAPVGNINIAKEKSCVGRGLGALRAKKDILNQMFLFYFMKKNENNWSRLSTGSTFSAIKGSSLKNFEIPLPPLATQKQIVERLDKIADAQKLNDGLIKKTDELFQSLLHKELNPAGKDWEVKDLGVICDVRDGTHESPRFFSEGIPLITSKNLIGGVIDFSNIQFISKKDYFDIEKRSGVDDGDILFGMIGTIGNPVIVHKNRDFSIKNVGLIKFTALSPINGFIYYTLLSSFVGQQIKKFSRGGTQKFVSLGNLRNLKIPLPPLQIQKQIVAKLSAVQEYKTQLLAQKSKLKELFDSVLSISFNSNLK